MSNFKFTPKRGVIANVQQFVRASTATAALTAANGLEAARFLNKSITDGLKTLDVAEEMAMANVSNFFSEQLGENISISDIRKGDLAEKVEEASKASRLLAVKRGQYRRAKEAIKLGKKIAKLEKKFALLKGEEQK